jgi:uridine kinase
MKQMLRHPLFLTGLALRLLLLWMVLPEPVAQWYTSFMDKTAAAMTIDPWDVWTQAGGSPFAFPYGLVMWLVLLPAALVAKGLGFAQNGAYGLTLLAVDLLLFLTLAKLVPHRNKLVLVAYWLSPVILLATYVLGFNDLIPALLMCAGILALQKHRYVWAGAALAGAVSAKLSMVVVVPLVGIYLYNNKPLRQHIKTIALAFAGGLLLVSIPFIASSSAIGMLMGNPEMRKVYQLSLSLGSGFTILLLPLTYLLLLYGVWRIRRLNFDMFMAAGATAFMLIVLLTPASPGWFVWCIPFLVYDLNKSDRIGIAMTCLFSLLYALTTLAASRWASNIPSVAMGVQLVALSQTTLFACGCVLMLRIWRNAIGKSDFFRFSRKPFVIGIAGDSASGKDTLSDALVNLLGAHSVVKLSGDDYHLWDRHKPMWQVMTHLNPMANDLERYSRDLLALVDGKQIPQRHYDHSTGKLSQPLLTRSNDFVVASGLHTLYLPSLRNSCDLRIYLEMDESLRRHFKLLRDVNERGHPREKVLMSLQSREADADRFIRTQAAHADLVFSLKPERPISDAEAGTAIRLEIELEVRIREALHAMSLRRVLVGVCGLHVDVLELADGSGVQMHVHGRINGADMALAASQLCPAALEFADQPAMWQEGPMGLMQLLILMHMGQVMAARAVQ